ncbi:hypothetical protein [Lysobacter fragariae]
MCWKIGAFAVFLAACQAAPVSQEAENSASESATHRTQSSIEGSPLPATVSNLDRLKLKVGAVCYGTGPKEHCEAGDYDLEFRLSCGRAALLGGVSNEKGARLVDKAPPDDSIKIATLSRGQIVCIQAVALAGSTPAWYYVVAMSEGDVVRCAADAPCKGYGDRPVEWHTQRPQVSCRSNGVGDFEGCAEGWTDAADLDAF